VIGEGSYYTASGVNDKRIKRVLRRIPERLKESRGIMLSENGRLINGK